MIALLGALAIQDRGGAIPPLEDSLALYREWSVKVGKAQRAEIDMLPPNNGEMHDLRYWFQRPGSGGVHGMSSGFDTDGRRSRSDCDAFGTFNRSAERDDLKKYLNLPGFESFFAPKAKVVGRGPLRIVKDYNGRFVAADLAIDGKPVTLYFDPISRTLRSYSFRPLAEGLSYGSMDGYYLSVELRSTKKPITPIPGRPN